MNVSHFAVQAGGPFYRDQDQGPQLPFGKVIQRMPVYDMASATKGPGGISRLLGFDIVFEFGGEHYQKRVSRNPGSRISVDVSTLSTEAVAAIA